MDGLLSASQWIYADGSLSWFTRWAAVSFFSATADTEISKLPEFSEQFWLPLFRWYLVAGWQRCGGHHLRAAGVGLSTRYTDIQVA